MANGQWLIANSAIPPPADRILVAQNEKQTTEKLCSRIGYYADRWSASLNAFPGAPLTFADDIGNYCKQ